ncbi:MAG TPA: glycosyltransferase family 4 protein [Steroidobacteraceae bacterium]|jgi:glycosyltransferase involved in cell wall biosynthesis|nr:glycosyltransferase family 4 protein [Steroidobacteraceae bacterium]
MHIAQIAPLTESIPPRLYGGTERVVGNLCDALVQLGHQVTLFAAADARTDAKLIAVRDRSIRLDPAPLKSDVAAHLSMLAEVRRRAWQFDVMHFHIDLLHFPVFEHQAHRTVTTLHGRLDLTDLEGAYRHWPQFGLVSISDHQRTPLPFVNWLATVPHGLPEHQFSFRERPQPGYLAFIGRISPEKRPDVAISIARRAGIPLKIAAKVDKVDRDYFETRIAPLLDHPLIDYIGEIGDSEKSEFLGNARALLFPIDWPEPFGLVMIEAMACGTPVIAWNRGSVPEVVEHGVTGYIVDSEEEALAALSTIEQLDRHTIRAVFERRFAARTMARAYVDLYARLLQSRPLLRAS